MNGRGSICDKVTGQWREPNAAEQAWADKAEVAGVFVQGVLVGMIAKGQPEFPDREWVFQALDRLKEQAEWVREWLGRHPNQ